MANFISIIIPVYNDPGGLIDTLESVSTQDYPENSFEIIIADNGSRVDTINVAEDFIKRFPKLIKIVVEDKIRSSYAARNKGIGISKGPIIAFIDADMTVEKDWLKKIDETFKMVDTYFLACNVNITISKKTIFSLYNKATGFNIERLVNKDHYCPTCCLSLKKELFKKIGLFDSRLISSGDYEFGIRAYNLGYSQYYNPEILMNHPARSGIKAFCRKYFRLGRGVYQLALYYPGMHTYNINNLRVLNYLPNSPVTVFKSFDFSKMSNLHRNLYFKIIFYFIHWTRKIITRLGFIYQKINQ
jgi:glycosyltransferase AglI